MTLTGPHSLTSEPSLLATSSELQTRATRPLRIVHVSASYAPLVGGGERLLQAVSERLVQRGHDVTVLTFDCKTRRDYTSSTGAGLPAHDVLNGVRIVRVKPSSPRLETLVRWWLELPGGWRSLRGFFGDDVLWPFSAPSGLRILRPLARLKADIVTSVGWCFGVSFWATPRRLFRRTPRVAIPVLHIEREWANKPIYNRMIADTDASIVCTEAERDFIEARGGRSVAVAGAGVDPDRFTRRNGVAIRARYGIGGRPVVGFVGRQDVTKGVPTLIEAMQTVWKEIPDAILLLAGQSAHRHEIVSEKLAGLNDARRRQVVLVDDFPDEELPSIMDACDLLALPSAEEAFGMVMIEAWMCGKPVIGADIASTRCIIDSGVDGWTAKPYDAPDLAAKILDLLSDPAKRAAFGERGRAKVLRRYTWDRVTDVWEATFRQAAKVD